MRVLPQFIVMGKVLNLKGDNVFFIAERNDIRMVMSELRKLDAPVRRVMIAGGGNIGLRLAKTLERTNKVRLIERDKDRARRISEKLRKTIVLRWWQSAWARKRLSL